MKVTIGGDRLGSGNKMTAETPHYNRSTHDQSYIWRSTMASGPLVPFLVEVGLRGDTWDIDLECDIMTQPTIGPLFGSFKVQLDVFTADVRLYQGKLHNNALNIGLKMDTVKLPQIQIEADDPDYDQMDIDNSQINPSCILKYLGIGGLGRSEDESIAVRYFNALSYISYWDIYKNYYANKQEEKGAVIHGKPIVKTLTEVYVQTGATTTLLPEEPTAASIATTRRTEMVLYYTGNKPNPNEIIINMQGESASLEDIFEEIEDTGTFYKATRPHGRYVSDEAGNMVNWGYIEITEARPPQIELFDLSNIDKMREDIIYHNSTAAFLITSDTYAPYGLPLIKSDEVYTKLTAQEGLGIKTYQSDIFNNWINTESIDGDNGINAITSIDTSEGEFQIDTLIMARKVYNMLNAVAISGGTYEDWQNVNWEQNQRTKVTTPVYHGGLTKELVFQEVISTAAATGEGQPLGTLGGRGKLSSKHKGGKVRIKVEEATYIMGIVSITPRIDYSQGNRWDVNLKSMDDFHKPALDNIGFQDLVTDKMAWWDTIILTSGALLYKSAGKQPAWLDYMTNYNRVYGNFAIQSNQGWMVLNRRYQHNSLTKSIQDLTTYIDPMLYNNVFAETARDAMNYWVQIGVNIESRKLLSAKMMPQG